MEFEIETARLTKKYKNITRVDAIDLCVPKEEVYGFLGPNGAGKTTTLKLLLGLTRSTSGAIRIFGQDAARQHTGLLAQIGALIESPSYYSHLSGLDNLRIVQSYKHLPQSEVARVLKIVRLENEKHKLVSYYSLGMKQRLAIACAMLGNPRLMVLDEPTNGLDPAGIQEIRELIKHMPSQNGTTVIVSSHLLSEIDQIATSVGIIHQGKLVFQGSMDSLRGRSNEKVILKMLDVQAAQTLLSQAGYVYKVENDKLILPAMDSAKLASLVRQMAMAETGLYSVAYQRKTLEDIFIEITGAQGSL